MRVLAIAAACEATLGAALLLGPPIVFRLLLGAEASGAGLVMSRIIRRREAPAGDPARKVAAEAKAGP